MRLYYYRDPAGNNFGDDLNPWLWSRILGDVLDDDPSELFVGIGTILNRAIPSEARKVVFGSGVGYGRMPILDERWRIYCVRGPLTAKALGLPEHLAVTDPALLVREFVPQSPRITSQHAASFIPHHKTAINMKRGGVDLQAVCEEIDIHYVDPEGSVEEIIRDIRDSGVVVAEAMHGAIVADALRVPWVPVQLSEHINRFKWNDWCNSIELNYDPILLPAYFADDRRHGIFDALSYAITRNHRSLSQNDVFDRLLLQMESLIVQMRDDLSTESNVSEKSENEIVDPISSNNSALGVFKVEPDLYVLHVTAAEIESLAGAGTSMILIDEEWIRAELNGECGAIPFLESGGQYWGPPPDDDIAIRELERLRRAGAKFAIVAWPAFWWLDYYTAFHAHLRANYPIVLTNERIIAFDLRSGG